MTEVSVFASTTRKFRCESGGSVTCCVFILVTVSFLSYGMNDTEQEEKLDFFFLSYFPLIAARWTGNFFSPYLHQYLLVGDQ